ncbi:MAG: hydroxymethylbilane synthase [Deltaproteobacteria bacterium]|nr:hydroxymethylbilane synthase [Deltaproteobacteria bacterium]
MTVSKVRIGTRGSTLAMWQARAVQEMLTTRYTDLEVELVIIKTTGDAIQDVALSKLPGKAFFTKEIEDALLDRRVDLAVHSGKDVPTEQPDGLILAGFLKRHSPVDVLVSKEGELLTDLPAGSRIGTSSLRRRALVAHLRPDLEILDLRGNVDTRLRKLDEGQYDAILLAAAGIERLGFGARITERLDPHVFLPAVSQGAMALEIRDADRELLDLIKPLTDKETEVAIDAERALLRTLEGGCQVPLGALATLKDGKITLEASIIAPDGSLRVDGNIEAAPADAERAGRELAEQLISRGGDKIIKMI